MKTRFLLLFPWLLVACDQPDQSSSDENKDTLAAIEALRAQAEEDRERFEAEQRRLQAEKDELQLQLRNELRSRELADIAAREAEANKAMEDAQLRDQQLAQRETELWGKEAQLTERETDLLERETELSEKALEMAGRDVLEEWTDDQPEEFGQPVADYDLFYDGLSDQGNWFNTWQYGYVFQPAVAYRNDLWRPYTYGRWVCSNLGWTWVSEEPFGWATYHYGRWVLLSGRGWCWVPGSEWAPSWVAWRHGGGHVGWAPLPPETLCVSSGGWGVTVDLDFGISDSSFCFVEERHFAEPIWKHCLPVKDNFVRRKQARACTNIRYVHNRVFSGGPAYSVVREKIGKKWPVHRLICNPVSGIAVSTHRQSRISGNHINVFTPNLDADWNAGLRPSIIADDLDNVEVERSSGGVKRQWAQKFQDFREDKAKSKKEWAAKFKQRPSERERTFQKNREAVSVALNNGRGGGRTSIAGTGQGRSGRGSSTPENAVSLPDGVRPAGPDNLPWKREPGAGRGDGPTIVFDEQQRNERDRNGRTPQNNGRDHTSGVTQDNGPRIAQVDPAVGVETTPNNRNLANQRADRIREVFERNRQAGSHQTNPQIDHNNGRTANNQRNPNRVVEQSDNNSRLEAFRELQERNRQAAERAADQAAAAQREQQERLRQQQAQAAEAAQAAQQQRQDQLRQQQERARQAIEEAQRANQQRLQEQQERMRQQQEQARQAAERAKQAMEQAQRERQERARQAAEQARRAMEEAQRAQQERARQAAEQAQRAREEAQRIQQERARQAAEQAQRAREEAQRRQQEQARRAAEQAQRAREEMQRRQEELRNRLKK